MNHIRVQLTTSTVGELKCLCGEKKLQLGTHFNYRFYSEDFVNCSSCQRWGVIFSIKQGYGVLVIVRKNSSCWLDQPEVDFFMKRCILPVLLRFHEEAEYPASVAEKEVENLVRNLSRAYGVDPDSDVIARIKDDVLERIVEDSDQFNRSPDSDIMNDLFASRIPRNTHVVVYHARRHEVIQRVVTRKRGFTAKLSPINSHVMDIVPWYIVSGDIKALTGVGLADSCDGTTQTIQLKSIQIELSPWSKNDGKSTYIVVTRRRSSSKKKFRILAKRMLIILNHHMAGGYRGIRNTDRSGPSIEFVLNSYPHVLKCLCYLICIQKGQDFPTTINEYLDSM